MSYKILKDNDFNQKTYQEIGKEIDLVNDTFIELEKEYSKFKKSTEPFDE